jgi:hypothetical protein
VFGGLETGNGDRISITRDRHRELLAIERRYKLLVENGWWIQKTAEEAWVYEMWDDGVVASGVMTSTQEIRDKL